MKSDVSTPRAHWGSRFGFIVAAAGGAVGLGNIWKFPYITGTNGGGWFVLIYLACILLVGLPILAAEIMIGRSAQKQPVVAFEVLQGRRTGWSLIGWMGIVAAFVIASFYIVVAGWTMDYTVKHLVDFSKPVRAEALEKSLNYQATEPLEDMAFVLTEDRAERIAKPKIAEIENSLPPSTWELYREFMLAMEPDDNRTSRLPEVAAEERRANLLIDPALAAAVASVEAVQSELDAARAEALAEAEAEVAAMSDEAIRLEATTNYRHKVIGDAMAAKFVSLLEDGWTSTFWAVFFMALTMAIVASGVTRGIELACRILMPVLIAMMIGLVIYAATLPSFGEALAFVFKPDAHALKPSGVLEALGHAFFSLGIGLGALITYGSYQKSKGTLFGESVWIAGLDTGIALLACMMMFPIIFAFGQDPGAGPGLVFISMPLAFAEIGSGGILLGAIFFSLLSFAAITSAISLLEVCASYLIDRWNWSRVRSTLVIGLMISLVGALVAFSSGDGFLFSSWTSGFGMNFFDTLDFVASNWLLPIGGLLIAIYAGWFLPKRLRDTELSEEHPFAYAIWLFLIRFIAPAMVLVVLAQKIGLFDANEALYTLWH